MCCSTFAILNSDGYYVELNQCASPCDQQVSSLTAHIRCLRIILQMCCSTFNLRGGNSRYEGEGARQDFTTPRSPASISARRSAPPLSKRSLTLPNYVV